MRRSSLERKLVVGILLLFLVPTGVAGVLLLVMYRQGVLETPAALFATVLVGFATMMAYLAIMTRSIGRALVRTLQEIQLGTELMATVNPDHRLAVRTGDELESLAAEVNRLADHLRSARAGLEGEISSATRALVVERGKLAAVLETLGEGVVVASPEGRVSLANRAAAAVLGGERADGASLLGRNLFDLVDREKIAHYLDRMEAAVTSERFSLHPPTGAVLEAVMTPFFDGDGRRIGFVLGLRDVTGPARLDEERRRVLTDGLGALRGPLAAVRSLSESLLDEPGLADGMPGRLLEAIHAEALRLSVLVREMSEPGRVGVARPPEHFESITVTDLVAMTLRRLPGDGGSADRVALEGDAASARVRAEASALSEAQARLLQVALARADGGGPAWLRVGGRGGVVQVEIGAAGRAPLAELETALDAPGAGGPAGRAPVREVIRRHAGEVWAYVGDGRLGFRLTLPVEDAAAAAPAGAEGEVTGPRFVGAGLVSGAGAGERAAERPDFYDFSLIEAMERAVAAADLERPLDTLTCVVLDTETTGLDPERGDRVVSVAGVRVRGATVRRGEVFDALVNPRRPIPEASVRFHGITDALVAEAPPMSVVLPAFLRFAEGAVLVGHQVWFDLRFLAAEATALGLPPPLARPVLDTLLLSAAVHGPLPGHGLDTVAGRLGVPLRGRHSALGDALTTAEVFVRLVELLRKRGVVTLGQALEAGRRARPALRDPPPGDGP